MSGLAASVSRANSSSERNRPPRSFCRHLGARRQDVLGDLLLAHLEGVHGHAAPASTATL
jgi:hypothetical protein